MASRMSMILDDLKYINTETGWDADIDWYDNGSGTQTSYRIVKSNGSRAITCYMSLTELTEHVAGMRTMITALKVEEYTKRSAQHIAANHPKQELYTDEELAAYTLQKNR